MLVAIDVGNSNIHLGEFTIAEKPKLRSVRLFSQTPTGRRDFYTQLAQYSSASLFIISDARGQKALTTDDEFLRIQEKFPKFIILRPKDLLGLKISYQPQQSLGTDRIAAAYGAYKEYQKDLVVIDFGTATTINLVTHGGEFLGGLILPGIHSIISGYPQHLVQVTNFRYSPLQPKPIATTTSQAVKFGLYYTVVRPILEIIKSYEERLKNKLFLVATGGGLKLYPPVKKIFHVINPYLTLKGLAYIYQIYYFSR
ncbi:MAG: type III pantothenate kinase [candidate division WOR-3 bacterium]